jgi:hypothetical protein
MEELLRLALPMLHPAIEPSKRRSPRMRFFREQIEACFAE